MRSDDGNPGKAARFATTHWSVVLAARQDSSPDAREALEILCRSYWYPLYAFARRLGYSPADAQDLTQAFFARLLEKRILQAADPERGQFRSFLLADFKHFLSHEWDRTQAQKRGGGRKILPLDFESGEGRYRLEPTHEVTAETLYERGWALMLLERGLTRLRGDYQRAGKDQLFDHLKGFLTGDSGTASYCQVAAELGMTEGAIKVAVHRLRGRLRELLLAEISQTVDDLADVDDELRHLFTVFRSPAR